MDSLDTNSTASYVLENMYLFIRDYVDYVIYGQH